MNKDTPLILVFYLDREMMSNKDIIVPFSESVDRLLVERKINAIAFFLPAGEGESERIDCINPVYIKDDQKEKVDKILNDLKINFDIDQGAEKDIDNPDNEIDL